MRVVPKDSGSADLELVEKRAARRDLVLGQRGSVTRIGELDAVPVNARRGRELVVKMDDHRIPDLQLEHGTRNLSVEGLRARKDAVPDVDDRLGRDDRRLDDVRVRVRIDDEGDAVRVAARCRHGRPDQTYRYEDGERRERAGSRDECTAAEPPSHDCQLRSPSPLHL